MSGYRGFDCETHPIPVVEDRSRADAQAMQPHNCDVEIFGSIRLEPVEMKPLAVSLDADAAVDN